MRAATRRIRSSAAAAAGLALVVVSACGGRSARHAVESDAGTGPSEGGSPGTVTPVAPDCAAPIRDCGPNELPPPPRYDCALDDPAHADRPLLAVATETSLYVVKGGGSLVEVHRFGLEEDEEHYRSPHVITRGPWIAAAVDLVPQHGGDATVELVIVDGSGNVAWHETLQTSVWFDTTTAIFGNEQGRFVFSRNLRDASFHRIVNLPTGKSSSERFQVRADPTPDGWMLVDDDLEPSGADYDWYDLEGGARFSSCHRLRPTYWSSYLLSPGLAYAPTDRAEIVYERGTDRCRVALESAWPPGTEYPTVVGSNPSGWLLTGWSEGDMRFAAANVATGASIPGFRFEAPEGYAFDEPVADQILRSAVIDQDGAAVILPVRSVDGEPAAQLHRSVGGASWQPIGEERRLAPEAAYARVLGEAGGTYVFSSYQATGTSRHSFTQLARPADDVVQDLPVPYASTAPPRLLSGDGRCFAYFEDDGQLELVDVTTGVTHAGPALPWLEAYQADLAFVPRPNDP